jgi:hypothetical protein
MSIPVAVDALPAELAHYRPAGYLLSGSGGAPHVVSVVPTWVGDQLETTCGKRTVTNVGVCADVVLLFAPIEGDGDFSLIVDTTATTRSEGDQWYVTLTPVKAIRHKNAS